jgi:hypothetical protein
MADKPTVIIKVSSKKTGKNDKLSIDDKEHPDLFAALKAYFEANPAHGRNKSARRGARLTPRAQKVELD